MSAAWNYPLENAGEPHILNVILPIPPLQRTDLSSKIRVELGLVINDMQHPSPIAELDVKIREADGNALPQPLHKEELRGCK